MRGEGILRVTDARPIYFERLNRSYWGRILRIARERWRCNNFKSLRRNIAPELSKGFRRGTRMDRCIRSLWAAACQTTNRTRNSLWLP